MRHTAGRRPGPDGACTSLSTIVVDAGRMSFFGFEQNSDLENEKRKFLEGGLTGAKQEDVAVYTWGEESYDGLGDALLEGGDELNDETFGNTGDIGASSVDGSVSRVQRVCRQGLRFLRDRPSRA